MELREIIGHIVAKHHITLSEDDPVLVLVTLNELVLKQYLHHAQLAQDNNTALVIAALQREVDTARALANQIVTHAGSYCADQVTLAGKELRTTLEQILTRHAEQIQTDQGAAKAHATTSFHWALVAAGSAVLAGLTTAVTMLLHR